MDLARRHDMRALYQLGKDEPVVVDLRGDDLKPHYLANSKFRDKIASIAAPLFHRSKDSIVGSHIDELRKSLVLSLSAVVCLLILFVAAVVMRRRAEEQRVEAVRQTAAARDNLAQAEFILGRISFDAHRVDDALLQWCKSHETAVSRSWQLSMENLIGAWSRRKCVLPHDGGITFAGFTPDGRRLITMGWDGVIRFWNVPTGTPAGAFAIAPSNARIIIASPDGGMVVAAGGINQALGGGFAQAWNTHTGTAMGKVMAHADSVTSVDIDRHGMRLVTGSVDSTAQLWNVRSSEPLGVTMSHDDVINTVAFSPDGSRVATGSKDKTARIWYSDSGKPSGISMIHDGEVQKSRIQSRWKATCHWEYG